MKICTVGTGMIVSLFLDAVNKIDSISCEAVYSRDFEKASSLASKFNVKKIFTNYDDILVDPNIDTVYIASPNSFHFSQAKKALLSKKNVICEKPITSTYKEIEELIAIAKKNKLFLFDAVTTPHLPNFKLIKENIHKIGEIKTVLCNYSSKSSRYDLLLNGESPNVFNLDFSGGCLVDLNLYNISFILSLFGSPKSVNYFANKHANGIDTSGVVILEYSDFICNATAAKDSTGTNFVYIQGEDGYIHVNKGANGCREFSITNKDNSYSFNVQDNENLLYYELLQFSNIVKNNDYNTCYNLLNFSLDLIKVLVSARESADIIFPADNISTC